MIKVPQISNIIYIMILSQLVHLNVDAGFKTHLHGFKESPVKQA